MTETIYYIVEIECFDGGDTSLWVDTPTGVMYVVIAIGDDDTAEVVDYGYRSREEAAKAWPDAIAYPFTPKGEQHD